MIPFADRVDVFQKLIASDIESLDGRTVQVEKQTYVVIPNVIATNPMLPQPLRLHYGSGHCGIAVPCIHRCRQKRFGKKSCSK